MLSHDTDSLAARGRAHTHLRELLDARSTILHDRERDVLLDAADALLFDESDAWEKREAAEELLDRLVESGRWLAEPADEVLSALDACGAQASGAASR